ncbi:serine protease [Sphaerospermopsis sp. FACHB-1194]|uniref:serine protease n=1 Tax=Sphaerospermopsis sp. FACHB-1194 TaxID=2692862 RepID=UPI0016816EE8|nr:serine protease [Sphaerospermopsis sp. FACHB-1194]MBD2147786.1 tetratricopeptide repeat protein [Sphaerospermopsis sp. FACHB-1194]
MNTKTVSIFSLAFLLVSTLSIETSSNSISLAAIDNISCQIKADNGDTGAYSQKQLQIIAKRITVRVIGDNNSGSGTLLSKRGNTYLVLTNSHVIRGVNKISLTTADGKTYNAQTVPNTNFNKFDLALLQFQSNENYCLQEVANSVPNTEMEVMAAGYSATKGQIVFRTGRVEKIADKPLKEGYQIGYSSDIDQGMSGGAIINSVGQIIGINGRSAYPILNTGYVYPDGSRPSNAEIQEMRKLSWGIPTSTLLAQVKPEILTAYSLPVPNISQPVPDVPALTGWLGEIEQKAKQITVRIDSSDESNGSGVIIAKEGDTYTVLTAAHIFCESENETQSCGLFNYSILAPDGKQYPIEKGSIKLESGVDLAVVKFRSPATYQIATLANHNPKDYEYILTAGYPKLGQTSPWRLTMGQIFSKEQGLFETNQSDFRNNSSGNSGNVSASVSQSAVSLTGGYELVYRSITFGGMSGGPVLDTQGRVIGIHGRAEGETAIDEKTGDRGSSGGKVQIGNSLGIPISTFLAIANKLDTQGQKVETTPAAKLNQQQVNSIQAAILSVDVSKGNTTASQWIERGNQLWRLRRLPEAIEAFDRAIQLKPAFIHLAYYGKGLALSSKKKYQEAVAPLQQAVKSQPDFVAAWSQLSKVYIYLQQPKEALPAINKAIELQPNNPNWYNEKSGVLSALKRYAEAEVAINEAIKLSPRSGFYTNRGNLYVQQKKWELALADYNQAININPDFALAYYNRGNLYSDQKKWELALADYNQAIKINPDDADAYNNRGVLYSDQKKWELALADYNQAIKINPDDAGAYNNRGALYSDQKKWELALADYNQAIKINPDLALAYYNRGLLYSDQKKWELALADYTQAININPDLAAAYNNRGLLYSDQKKWELALADYNQAIKINPDYALAYYNRGLVYDNQKKWELALADYTQAIKINPDYAQAYNNRGNLYHNQKKWELALADYNQAIKINPDYAEAYYNRGNLYYEQKKWELALADFNQAIKINPDYAKAYNNRGGLYKNQKKWELALADYNQAIKINPDDAQAYYNRGLVYDNQKKWELALADYNQAININPDLAAAYNNRGLLYSDQKKWELALADYNQAIKINPDLALAYYNRGLLYSDQKKWELALADYNQAIKINPDYAQAYNNRGVLYKNQKKWELALADYTQAININPDYADAYKNRGVLYYNQKKWELALADFNQAIKINPDYAQAYMGRGLVYYQLGDKQKAIENFQQAAQLLQAQGNVALYQQIMDLLKGL